MRRSDREITDFRELLEVIENSDVCRIALNDEGYPYILPLNFGQTCENGKITLYFHGAMTGTKYELIDLDNRASFEMDLGHQLFTNDETMSCSMAYKSVIGRGHIAYIEDPKEKLDALKCIMAHYHKEDFPFNESVAERTRIFKLEVESMTGKSRRLK